MDHVLTQACKLAKHRSQDHRREVSGSDKDCDRLLEADIHMAVQMLYGGGMTEPADTLQEVKPEVDKR